MTTKQKAATKDKPARRPAPKPEPAKDKPTPKREAQNYDQYWSKR